MLLAEERQKFFSQLPAQTFEAHRIDQGNASRPPVPKTGATNSKLVSKQQVVATIENQSASVSPRSQKVVAKSEQDSVAIENLNRKSASNALVSIAADNATPADFASALAMIVTLPLSDVEKAEAVRRLLASPDA